MSQGIYIYETSLLTRVAVGNQRKGRPTSRFGEDGEENNQNDDDRHFN